MKFSFGDKVVVSGQEELGVVVAVDSRDTDLPYKVRFEAPDGEEGEWEWMPEALLALYKGFGDPVILGTVQPSSGLVDAFGMPLGRRMQYDNSSARRKDQPVTEGYLDYFPATARLTAELSRLGNEKHNPGEPLHHARAKSKDHRNCAVRHLMDADTIDPESGLVEAVGAVWRSSAYVQELAENVYGWPKAPRAR